MYIAINITQNFFAINVNVYHHCSVSANLKTIYKFMRTLNSNIKFSVDFLKNFTRANERCSETEVHISI